MVEMKVFGLFDASEDGERNALLKIRFAKDTKKSLTFSKETKKSRGFFLTREEGTRWLR